MFRLNLLRPLPGQCSSASNPSSIFLLPPIPIASSKLPPARTTCVSREPFRPHSSASRTDGSGFASLFTRPAPKNSGSLRSKPCPNPKADSSVSIRVRRCSPFGGPTSPLRPLSPPACSGASNPFRSHLTTEYSVHCHAPATSRTLHFRLVYCPGGPGAPPRFSFSPGVTHPL